MFKLDSETKKDIKTLLSMLLVASLFIGTMAYIFTDSRNIGLKRAEEGIEAYEKSKKGEVFEHYNNDYMVSGGKMRSVVVQVRGPANYAYKLVNNYISNVNGKIAEKTLNLSPSKEAINLFTLEVPLDALYADNLQEEVNLYYIYSYLLQYKAKERLDSFSFPNYFSPSYASKILIEGVK